ncbi:unnamed protein product [Merluccius merluccius]
MVYVWTAAVAHIAGLRSAASRGAQAERRRNRCGTVCGDNRQRDATLLTPSQRCPNQHGQRYWKQQNHGSCHTMMC